MDVLNGKENFSIDIESAVWNDLLPLVFSYIYLENLASFRKCSKRIKEIIDKRTIIYEKIYLIEKRTKKKNLRELKYHYHFRNLTFFYRKELKKFIELFLKKEKKTHYFVRIYFGYGINIADLEFLKLRNSTENISLAFGSDVNVHELFDFMENNESSNLGISSLSFDQVKFYKETTKECRIDQIKFVLSPVYENVDYYSSFIKNLKSSSLSINISVFKPMEESLAFSDCFNDRIYLHESLTTLNFSLGKMKLCKDFFKKIFSKLEQEKLKISFRLCNQTQKTLESIISAINNELEEKILSLTFDDNFTKPKDFLHFLKIKNFGRISKFELVKNRINFSGSYDQISRGRIVLKSAIAELKKKLTEENVPFLISFFSEDLNKEILGSK